MSAASSTTDTGLGTALVTGATSGIGRATALRLARDGWEVVVHGRNPERGAEVVREIEAHGGRARFVAADLNDVAAVRALVDEVGDVDVLVNNAGTVMVRSDGGSRRGDLRRSVRRQRALGVLPRRRDRPGHGRTVLGEHHQPGQHGRTDRPRRWCRLRGHQGGAQLDDPVLGGRVQPPRRPGQRRRRRAGVQHARKGTPHRATRQDHPARTRAPRSRRSPRSSPSSPRTRRAT